MAGSNGTRWLPSMDSYAAPSRPAKLTVQQRSQTLFSMYSGYLHTTFRIPPYNPDSLFAAKGYDAMGEMLADGAVNAPVSIKIDAILAKGVRVVPCITDEADPNWPLAKQTADFCQYMVENIESPNGGDQAFEDALAEILDGIFMGVSCTEIIWREFTRGSYAGKWGLECLSTKPMKQISFDLDPDTGRPTNVTQFTPFTGYKFDGPVEKFIIFTHKQRESNVWGVPDARAVYRPWWIRNVLYKSWAVALETFGSPWLNVTAGTGVSQDSLAQKVQAIRNGAPAVWPKGTEVELVNMSGQAMNLFSDAAEHMKGEIAYNILYQTLTTSVGNRAGSNALGEVHADTQEYGIGARRRYLSRVISRQLFRRAVIYNFGEDAADYTPVLDLGKVDNADVLRLSQAYALLLDRQVIHRTEPFMRADIGAPPVTEQIAKLLDLDAQAALSAGTRAPTAQPAEKDDESGGGRDRNDG